MRLCSPGLMAGISGCHGEAALQVGRELVIPDCAGKAAVSGAEQAAVPALGGKPDFEADPGVNGGTKLTGDAAECGEITLRCGVGDFEHA